ncbi:helix-turn-helix domain-containing protein [Jatrophihabitans sp.]|uniref:helix-turn-helix domain-containing protein n=1 Tax=Jatrophihabitans sp. TaxID=1932789 RepID=UPI0030C66608|nr:putative transcriptional regulator, PucR family [Jatrophihabitans sp.]
MTWPTLPVPWVRSVSTGVPALARDIVEAILEEIPEYKEITSAPVLAETQRTVNEALHTFIRWLSSPRPLANTSPTAELLETFRELGRAEAMAGRSHDTLQAAYRIASRTIMRRLLEWEREFPIPAERVGEFSSAVFGFIDDLAEFSAQGYTDALSEGPNVARERARLLGLLLDPRGYSAEAVAVRAERVDWTVPVSATLIDVNGLPDGYGAVGLSRLARTLLGERALAGRALGRDLIVTPEPPDAAVLADLIRALEPDVWLAVGFHVSVDLLATSFRWLRRLGALRDTGELPALPVLLCDTHPLDLVQDAGREVYDRLVERRLGPLLQLSPSKRLKYGRLLSAWLELGSVRGEAPGVLDKHRQTLRYQVARLEAMFGDQLTEREARVELMLALRAVLPVWEREELALT